jgi:hypothetical protein
MNPALLFPYLISERLTIRHKVKARDEQHRKQDQRHDRPIRPGVFPASFTDRPIVPQRAGGGKSIPPPKGQVLNGDLIEVARDKSQKSAKSATQSSDAADLQRGTALATE